MKRLFVEAEVNTSRQIEFDILKVVLIIEMIFTHCFEQFEEFSDCTSHPLYYIIVIVIDVMFGAAGFVGSMGLGMAYGRLLEPGDIMQRGVRLFCAGYLLNFLRDTIFRSVLSLLGILSWKETLGWTFVNDILQFAGLSFILFGFLRKIKCSDLMMFLIALAMSVIGSFVRFINFGSLYINLFAGLFIGTVDPFLGEEDTACFPLFNWFIVVVVCYLYAKKLRHCSNTERFYSMALPLSGLIVGAYMLYAIPNRFGMLSGNLCYYYHFSTPNVLILFSGMVFMTSVSHFVSKLLPEKIKKKITQISSNLTPTYFVQWIIIGNMYIVPVCLKSESIQVSTIIVIAVCVSVISLFLGNHCPRSIKNIIS